MTIDRIAVETESGTVLGLAFDGFRRWRSIPYAAPPIGERRWMAPQPHPGWTEPRDATVFGPRSMQPAPPAWPGHVPVDEPVRLSEDSLLVHIIAPDGEAPSGGWPVLFHVHGGGLIGGSPVEFGEGESFAAAGIVMVSVQYRLGPFGYLDLSSLDTAEADSGVAGLLDQIEALEWTRRNIAAFGGNPDSITVLGGSAGAKSVAFLLASPRTKGMITRAVMCSGTGNLVATPKTAAEHTLLFVEALSEILGRPVTGVDELRSVEAAHLLEASRRIMPAGQDTWFWRPTLHPEVLPRIPVDAIADGTADGVDLLIGTCLREGEFFAEGENLPSVLAEAERNIEAIVGDGRAEEVIGVYKSSRPGITHEEAVLAVFGDAQYGIPTIRVADAQSQNAEVWRYRLDLSIPGLSSFGLPVGHHGADSPILWGVRVPPETPGVVFEEDAEAIARACDLFAQAVRSFIMTGQPSSPDLEWPGYDPERRATLVVDAHPHIEDDPRPAERSIWGDASWLASTWYPIRTVSTTKEQ